MTVLFPSQTITILMATRNGARFLGEQLASLSIQTDRDWRLWVSDDGSTDSTCDLVKAFGRDHPVRLFKGPCRGPAQNFLSLLMHADLPAGPVAFADQDDVWMAHKIERARQYLEAVPAHQPALYGAASLRVDAALRPLSQPRPPRIAPSFGNALVQNLFSGHTMALNAPAVALARRAGLSAGIRHHDWWLYQLFAGAGGHLILDPAHVAFYRQHGQNVVGTALGPVGMLRRLRRLVSGNWGKAMRQQALVLRQAEALLTPAAKTTLDAVLDDFPSGGVARAAAFRRHALTRSTSGAGLAMQVCACFGRV